MINKREIKFRVWNQKKNKWICDINNPLLLGIEVNENEFENVIYQQYIGLKDCKGKEIYEGDILDADKGYFTWNNCIVTWFQPNCSFELIPNVWYNQENPIPYHLRNMADFASLHSKVIGNIFETPELLKIKMKTNFKIGDKIFNLYNGDIATMVELTTKGFKYEYDKQKLSRWGFPMPGGECFTDMPGYEIGWELYTGNNKIKGIVIYES